MQLGEFDPPEKQPYVIVMVMVWQRTFRNFLCVIIFVTWVSSCPNPLARGSLLFYGTIDAGIGGFGGNR